MFRTAANSAKAFDHVSDSHQSDRSDRLVHHRSRGLWGILLFGLVSGAALCASTAAALAADSQPSIEENYDYPAAEKIFQERGIRLHKGDGHILLVDCNSGTGFAEAWSRSKGQLCFQITKTGGYLTMDLPEVYVIKGASNHTIQVTVTVNGKVETIKVQSDRWTPVGEGADEKSSPATLREFRTSA
jgi:hypothetical protein